MNEDLLFQHPNVTPRVRLIIQRIFLIGKEHHLASSELKQRSATFLEGMFLALGLI